jgi:hypothetical protein
LTKKTAPTATSAATMTDATMITTRRDPENAATDNSFSVLPCLLLSSAYQCISGPASISGENRICTVTEPACPGIPALSPTITIADRGTRGEPDDLVQTRV